MKIGSEKALVRPEMTRVSSLPGAGQAILMVGPVMSCRSQKVTRGKKGLLLLLLLLHEAPSLMSPPRWSMYAAVPHRGYDHSVQ